MAKAVISLSLLQKILRVERLPNKDKNHDCFGKTGMDQWKDILDRWQAEGRTEIDLAQTTYDREPIIRIVEE